jgi:hypothetical protein
VRPRPSPSFMPSLLYAGLLTHDLPSCGGKRHCLRGEQRTGTRAGRFNVLSNCRERDRCGNCSRKCQRSIINVNAIQRYAFRRRASQRLLEPLSDWCMICYPGSCPQFAATIVEPALMLKVLFESYARQPALGPMPQLGDVSVLRQPTSPTKAWACRTIV